MADNRSKARSALPRKAVAEPDLDALTQGVQVLTQALKELDVSQHFGAEC